MKISVIIPTRNRFDYINLLIGDLQNQTVSDFELIVVDQSFDKKTIDNCTHIFIDSTGPCVSRNIGVAQSNGDILVFLDDDARVNANFIEEMTKPIIDGKYHAVAGAMCDLDGNYISTKEKYLSRPNINFIKVLTSNPNSPESRISLSFPGCCSAVLKKVFIKVGGFDESFDPTGAGEDREMAIKLYKNGFSTFYNAKAKLLHVQAPIGGSRDVGSRTLMLNVHSYKICKKHFSDALADVLKENIIQFYRRKFIKSIFTLKSVRSNYNLWKEVKQLLE